MDTRELPDIPGLESADSRNGRYTAVVGCMLATFLPTLVMIVPMGVIYYRDIPMAARVMLWLVGALLGWIVVRGLFSFSRILTSDEGITLKAPLRSRTISWRSVLGASQVKGRLGVSIRLITTAGSYKIGLLDGNTSRARVLASTWQHLRRNQVPNDIELDETALSFWEPIPADVPEEMESNGPRCRYESLIIFGVFGLSTGALIIWIAIDAIGYPLRLIQAVYVAMLMAPFFVFMGPVILGQARSIRVRRDCLDVDLSYGSVRISWSSITDADWNNGLVIAYLRGKRRAITVPYAPGKAESEALILAILRRLRELPRVQPVPFPMLATRHPEALRKPTSDSKQQARMRAAFLNTLELKLRKKMSRLQGMCVTGVMLGFILGFALIFPDPCARLSKYLHAGPGTRFFFATDTLPLVVPLMISLIVLFSAVLALLARRLAGPDIKTWEELQKIAPDPKWSKTVGGGLVALSVAAVLVVGPLMVDAYWKVTDNGVAFSRFWGFGERSYTWNQIADFNDRRYEQPTKYGSSIEHEYTITFRDGQTLVIDNRDCLWRNREQVPLAIDFIRAHIPPGR